MAPVAVFEEWKKYHSVEALRNETDLSHRKFIIGKMACPRQAGIHAADYTNALLLAVATNRTFLFKYGGSMTWVRSGVNAPEVCDQILHRANWIPRLEDFEDHLDMKTMASLDMTPFKESLERVIKMNKNEINENIHLVDPLFKDVQVYENMRTWGLSRMPGLWFGLANLTDVKASSFYSQLYGLEKSFAQDERVQQLYMEGGLFLYGMLYAESFSYSKELLQSVASDMPAATEGDEDTVFSIGMHSRHPSEEQNGTHIHGEKQCLDYLMENRNTGHLPCRVHLMSDRELTIGGVSTYAKQKYNCSVVVTSNPTLATTEHTIQEHGKTAGMGYFQDLALVSEAKSAFMSQSRSSSALVMEMMDYNRKIKAWKESGQRNLPAFAQCSIKE
jgi:hypothetical protein